MSDGMWLLAADRCMARALEVDRWVEAFARRGIRLLPYTSSTLRVVAGDDGLALTNVVGTPLSPPRLCVARVYERHLPAALELMGTTCLPSWRMIDLCYDKVLVSQLVAAAGVPTIETVTFPELTSEIVAALAADARDGRRSWPIVLKPARGRGGERVVLARDEGELYYEADRLIGVPTLVQPLVDPGRDLRVYVVGGKPCHALERLGAPGDFRSNRSVGGTARPARISATVANLVGRVLAALPEQLSFGSVDFCYREGIPVFCEVNANIGCRLPYEYGNFDIIDEYATWLAHAYPEVTS